jgi:uncharacterized protein YcsI (UPF0317 family)
MAMSKLLPPSLPRLLTSAKNDAARLAREQCRLQKHNGPTANLAPGFMQANLVVLEKRFAFDFLLFAIKNPKACPILDIIDNGEVQSNIALGSDIRKDLPKYRVWKNGKVGEQNEVVDEWPKDAVSFLLGCSFTFEAELKNAGLLNKNSSTVSMYRTTIRNEPSGPFKGNLVVSMRFFRQNQIDEVVRITAKHELNHGAPVKIGWNAPRDLGIKNIGSPDYGEPPEHLGENMVPIFWACGVTPQSAIEEAAQDLKDTTVITHSPGCMFITDVSIW